MVTFIVTVVPLNHCGRISEELGAVYTTAELELRCKAPGRRKKLHAKLQDPHPGSEDVGLRIKVLGL